MSDRACVCAFCLRGPNEVRHLVVSDRAVAICDECVLEALAALVVTGAVEGPKGLPPSAFYRRRSAPIV